MPIPLDFTRQEGFEPPNDGVRVHCLTAWRLPIVWYAHLNELPRCKQRGSGKILFTLTEREIYLLILVKSDYCIQLQI